MSLKALIRQNIRYKLLALALSPILLLVPIALAIAIYWSAHFSYEQLLIKVNTDLSVAHDVFLRLQRDYLNRLVRLSDSYQLQRALENHDVTTVQQLLQQHKPQFAFLHLVDSQGRWLYEDETKPGTITPTPLLQYAQSGHPQSGIEILSQHALKNESLTLADAMLLPLIDTPKARKSQRTIEDRAMIARLVAPIIGQNGKIIAFFDAGVLLNRNFEFVDHLRDLVYGKGSLHQDSIGTVTIFLEDVRISTNVPLRPDERALGTRVSNEVRTRVLDQGQTWIDRAFVVNDWYISAYEPIIDTRGKRVGILYAGFLEQPYRETLWQALWIQIGLFLILMSITGWLAIRTARSIFQPLEKMSDVIVAIRDGNYTQRIGSVPSEDEIAALAQEFDAMLNRLETHQRQLTDWGEQLESMVDRRTQELQQKNNDLLLTIQALRKTRQKLVETEKLAALGELTAGVAHEINNPVQVILGSIELINVLLGKQSGEIQEESDLIIAQVERIREIINDLLQYAHVGQYTMHLDHVEINALVTDTFHLIKHMCIDDVDITTTLEADIPIQINAQELQQVLVNLISNSLHAIQDNQQPGRLTIHTKNWEQRGIILSVSDNGCGIDDEQLDHIFNPFYSTKKQGEGTGLGLSVSYGLVRRYGGNITAVSTLGEGSTFRVWLLKEPQMITDEKTISEQLNAIENQHA